MIVIVLYHYIWGRVVKQQKITGIMYSAPAVCQEFLKVRFIARYRKRVIYTEISLRSCLDFTDRLRQLGKKLICRIDILFLLIQA